MLCMAGSDLSILHYKLQMGFICEDAQILEGICIDNDQVCHLTGCEGPQPPLPTEGTRRVPCRSHDPFLR